MGERARAVGVRARAVGAMVGVAFPVARGAKRGAEEAPEGMMAAVPGKLRLYHRRR